MIEVGDLVRFKLPSGEQQLLIDTLGKKQAEGVWLVVDRGAKIVYLQQGNTKKVAPDRYVRKV